MTYDNLGHLWQLVPICQIGKINKILNEVPNLEKCDRQTEDRRQTDGVTDNASTREACASKNGSGLKI